MIYKEYEAEFKYDKKSDKYYGTIKNIKDVITFTGNNPIELISSFIDSVDDYIDFCRDRKELPNIPK